MSRQGEEILAAVRRAVDEAAGDPDAALVAVFEWIRTRDPLAVMRELRPHVIEVPPSLEPIVEQLAARNATEDEMDRVFVEVLDERENPELAAAVEKEVVDEAIETLRRLVGRESIAWRARRAP